ncbi:MAG: hypothetical protein ACI9QC_000673 [Oceanicoccus sp.]|jgi:hypothetical protein
MKRFIGLLALSSIILSACNTETDQNFDVGGTPTAPVFESQVWDQEETDYGVRLTTQIENPSTGNQLYTYLELPEGIENPPLVMLIPGGTNSGTDKFIDNDLSTNFLLENNIAVAYFDLDGRGKSDGDENQNGSDAQDGLYAITQVIEESGYIDTEEMGLMSLSYGLVLGSGMLANYAETQPYEWYIDWEGPSSPAYTPRQCDGADCDDEEYWLERDASTSLSEILVPYWRFQAKKDHVQSENSHAILAINAATNGSSPWTQINYEDPNQTFSEENPPEYIAKRSQEAAIKAVLEFFEMY